MIFKSNEHNNALSKRVNDLIKPEFLEEFEAGNLAGITQLDSGALVTMEELHEKYFCGEEKIN